MNAAEIKPQPPSMVDFRPDRIVFCVPREWSEADVIGYALHRVGSGIGGQFTFVGREPCDTFHGMVHAIVSREECK